MRPSKLIGILPFIAWLVASATAAEAHAPQQPAPIIFELAHRPLVMPGDNGKWHLLERTWISDLQVRSDGSWQASDGRFGQLARRDIWHIRRAIAVARFRLGPQPQIRCRALPLHEVAVFTPWRHVTWKAPCAVGPHASVRALVSLVQSLTADTLLGVEPIVTSPPANAVLVTYRRSSFLGRIRSVEITVYDDGAFVASTTPGSATGAMAPTRGTLSPERLLALRSAIASAQLDPSQPGACINPPPLDGGLTTLHIGDVGSQSWIPACGAPHPSLEHIVNLLSDLIAR